MAVPKPVIFSQFGGLSTRYDVGKVPPGMLVEAHNIRFREESLTSRPGQSRAQTAPLVGTITPVSINGLGSFRTKAASGFAASNVLVFEDSLGNIFAENPFPGQPVNGDFVIGNGAVMRLSNPAFPITAGDFMDTAAAYGSTWMAFSNNQVGDTAVGLRQFYFDQGTKRFHFSGVGFPNNATPLANYFSTADPGDMIAGARYAVVIFETRSGYQTGWTIAAIKRINISAAAKQLHLSGIPVGNGPQITKRIVAFTTAGSSSDGPYFYIAQDDFIQGLNAATDANGHNIFSTVINDNFTTELVVNFPDEFLIGQTDVTDFPDKGASFAAKSVFYSKTLRRMIWCGEDDDTFRVSSIDDPEDYRQSTGLNQPGQGDGGTAMCAREFRTELYFFKNNGAHLLVDSSLEPSQWVTRERWNTVGPEGPWAIDVTKAFMAFAHRSGPYIFDGTEPQWIGYHISGNANRDPAWEKINWDQAHKIYVVIDTDNLIVKFGVPYGRSTKVDRELICDYSKGWKNVRWSWDDVTATRALFVKRTQNVSDMTLTFDGRVRTGQILSAMNDDSGRILYEDPGNDTLDGGPFVQEAQTGYTPYQNVPGIYGLSAVDTVFRGSGFLDLTVLGDTNLSRALLQVPLEGEIRDHDRKVSGAEHERFALRFSNGGRLSDTWEAMRVCIWIYFKWRTRSV